MIQVEKNQEQTKSNSESLIFVNKSFNKTFKKLQAEITKKVKKVLETPVEKLEEK